MNAQEFCYWLQGRAELLPDQPPTQAEWQMIREHLALVFRKVTPPLGVRENEFDRALRKLVEPRTPDVAPGYVLPQILC